MVARKLSACARDLMTVYSHFGAPDGSETPTMQYIIAQLECYSEHGATGLMNGYSYQYKVSSVNGVGKSAQSNAEVASPFGDMSAVSVIASGKTLTIH